MSAVGIIYHVSLIVVLASMLLALLRLILGPYPIDRVVALDVLTINTISLIVGVAWLMGRFIYLDIALVYALISFLGVIAIARYLEGGLK